jgi:uncharacterized membrane protein YccC
MWHWLQSKSNPVTVLHAFRTAAGGVVSFLIARLCHITDPHWAAISTLVVMQTNFGTSLPISIQRFAGTAVGATMGGLIGTLFPLSVVAFGLGILLIGLLCAAFRAERPAYRYAGITLAIVVLIPHEGGAWHLAMHRFLGVSLGILIGLLFSYRWPEHPAA